MKLHIMMGLFMVLALSAGLVLAAKPDLSTQLVAVNPSGGHATVSIPAHAIEVTPGVFRLGIAVNKGRFVEGYAFVDYKEAHAKPGTECGNGICEPGENVNKCPQDCTSDSPEEPTDSCYTFLSKGTRWRAIEPFVVNPSNTRGLSETSIINNLALDISKWETAADADIIGSGASTAETLVADTSSPDGTNEVYFGDIAESGAIGVSIVWGIFRGPPTSRELVEWDQVYDDIDFDWSEDCTTENCATKMDFSNIATHELGHTVGMGDLYESACSEQTMYGYASYGETKKRTLENGDKTGIRELYA